MTVKKLTITIEIRDPPEEAHPSVSIGMKGKWIEKVFDEGDGPGQWCSLKGHILGISGEMDWDGSKVAYAWIESNP